MSPFTSACHRSLRLAFSLLLTFLLSQFSFGASIKVANNEDGQSTAIRHTTETGLADIFSNKTFVFVLVLCACLNITVVSICMISLYLHYYLYPPTPPSADVQKVPSGGGKQELDWAEYGEDGGWDDGDLPPAKDSDRKQMDYSSSADDNEDRGERATMPVRAAKSRGTVFSKGSSAAARSVHTVNTKNNRVTSRPPSPLKKVGKGGGGGGKRSREKNKKKAPVKKIKGSRRTVASKSSAASPQGGKGGGGGGKKKIKKAADKKGGRKASKGKQQQQPKQGEKKGEKRKNAKKGQEKKSKQTKEVDNSQLYDQGVQFYKQFLKSAHSVKSVSQYFEKGN